MTQLAEGAVQMGTRVAYVQTWAETARKSYYHVTGLRRGTAPFPGEVTVNAASLFLCTTCRKADCIHADAVRKFLATQPLDPAGMVGMRDGAGR